jgi:hypothetical protein
MKTHKTSLLYKCNVCDKMYQYRNQAEFCFNSHKTRKCISCLKLFTLSETLIFYDYCALEVSDCCGYGSPFDGTSVKFVVCSKCMERFLKDTKELK